MSAYEYGQFSLVLTFVSLIFSFSLLGLEQVMMRTAIVEEHGVKLDRKVISYLLPILIISALIFTFVLRSYYPDISILELFLFVIFSSLLMFFYNLFRLKSAFSISQLVGNGWKIVLLFPILLIPTLGFDNFFSLLVFILGAVLCLTLFYGYKTLSFELFKSTDQIYGLWFNFSITLLLLSLIGYSDRYLVEAYLGLEAVGEYFYYLTVILFPYMLFQNYFGFKELPQFKQGLTLELLYSKLRKVILFSILLSLILLGFFLILNDFEELNQLHITNYILVLILMLTGIVKVLYSIFSAAIGARAKAEEIKRINLFTLGSIVVVIILLMTFSALSIELIALAYMFIWMIRVMISYRVIVKALND